MKRTTTGLCFAAAFGLAATLGAQSTTTSQPGSTTADKDEITVTGCLSKTTSGSYMLSNARMENSASSTTTTSGTPTSGTTSPTTAGGSATTAGTSGVAGETRANAGRMANSMATTWMLSGDSNLEKHVGHKIQVTGKASDSAMEHGRTSTTTTSGTGTTAATGSATTGSSSDHPVLDVKSIKMVSTSCS